MSDAAGSEVMAIGDWPSNAELVAHGIVRLGYLTREMRVLDPTWGLGVFWKLWQPDELIASDIDGERSPIGRSVNFAWCPFYRSGHFDAVVLDPPYKLNGTSTGRGAAASDARYGVTTSTRWQDRVQLMRDMLTEAERVVRPKGIVLFKCQDQVVSGHKVWQTDEMSAHAATLRLTKVDEMHIMGYRAQPSGQRQVHSRGNYSTMLVFRKGKR